MDAPLIMTDDVRAALESLRARAALAPVDVRSLKDQIATAQGDRTHRQQMNRQTVVIPGPWPFYVTFSIETGHPAGACRHMSMSIRRAGRVPHPAAVEMVAAMLGFVGGMKDYTLAWPEKLSDGGTAINIIQEIAYWARSPAEPARA